MIPGRVLRPLLRRGIRRGFDAFFVVVGSVVQSRRRAREITPVRRILLIRLDLLGDLVFSMTAVQALRQAYPDSTITVLALPYTASLAATYPDVDEVVAVDTNRIRSIRGLFDPSTWRGYYRVFQLLRAHDFDLALSLSGPMASLWAFLSGARRTVGYEGEAYHGLLSDPMPGGRYGVRKHEVEYVRDLAAHIDAPRIPYHLSAPVDAASEEQAAAWLRSVGVEPNDRFVLIHAGAGNGAAKRWPVKYWAAFARMLHRQTKLPVVLVGGDSDSALADDIVAGSEGTVRSLVGKTSVEELVAVIDRAALVVTADSAPLHLAVARERPLLALFGPTDPVVYGPYHPVAPSAILRADLPCSPCYTMAATAECPLGDPICMRLISVPQAVQAAERLLSGSGVFNTSAAD